MDGTRRLRSATATALTALLGIVLVGGTVGQAVAAPAASHRGAIHPGGAITVAGQTCEIGFLLHVGKSVYAAFPASCAGINQGQTQDGCSEAEAPVGMPVTIAGAAHRATLVYKSFTQMALAGTTKRHPCYYNDLALAKLARPDRSRASGTIPGLHAPTGVVQHAPASTTALTLVAGVHDAGTAGTTTSGGWVHQIKTAGVLGESNVGAPAVIGSRVLGMLTVLPAGVLIKTAPEVYNLARELKRLRQVPRFRHIAVLRAGERG